MPDSYKLQWTSSVVHRPQCEWPPSLMPPQSVSQRKLFVFHFSFDHDDPIVSRFQYKGNEPGGFSNVCATPQSQLPIPNNRTDLLCSSKYPVAI